MKVSLVLVPLLGLLLQVQAAPSPGKHHHRRQSEHNCVIMITCKCFLFGAVIFWAAPSAPSTTLIGEGDITIITTFTTSIITLIITIESNFIIVTMIIKMMQGLRRKSPGRLLLWLSGRIKYLPSCDLRWFMRL